MPNTVEQLYRDYEQVKEILDGKGELGLSSRLGDTYKKVLVLAAASQFEAEICEALILAVNKRITDNRPLGTLLSTAFAPNTYYRLFKWKKIKEDVEFFDPFGADFKKWYKDKTSKDATFATSAASFIELSRLRNEVVHKNFAEYEGLKNKTAEEIYNKYKLACPFLKEIKIMLG